MSSLNRRDGSSPPCHLTYKTKTDSGKTVKLDRTLRQAAQNMNSGGQTNLPGQLGQRLHHRHERKLAHTPILGENTVKVRTYLHLRPCVSF